jgi:hypothetical protein
MGLLKKDWVFLCLLYFVVCNDLSTYSFFFFDK